MNLTEKQIQMILNYKINCYTNYFIRLLELDFQLFDLKLSRSQAFVTDL